MFHSWLDRWDERRALEGDKVKRQSAFSLGASLAFPGLTNASSVAEFCERAEKTVLDGSFFEAPKIPESEFERQGRLVRFPSEVPTEIAENNVVLARITEATELGQALVVFHHWNAEARNDQLAKFLSRRGITVVEMALPYHFERQRPGALHADNMLSPNLGRTLQSMRQAVSDGRNLIRWLNGKGYQEISVLGMSLGSWVAGLIAAHDHAVSKASLFLTAGSLADMVWTGRATRLIRESLEPSIGLADLQRAWSPVDVARCSKRLARSGLDLQVVLARRDKVVLPDLSEKFVTALETAGSCPDIHRFNCGHYSLGRPPYILSAGFKLARFLSPNQ